MLATVVSSQHFWEQSLWEVLTMYIVINTHRYTHPVQKTGVAHALPVCNAMIGGGSLVYGALI